MSIDIRPEVAADYALVHRLNVEAFGQPFEADLVERLRNSSPDFVSLVADDEGTIVGHILFTSVSLEAPAGLVSGMGLAPMAVTPTRQRSGIGTRLVERGLALLRQQSVPFVVVVGHPEYYPRFGFAPAADRGIASQWPDMPAEAFMVLVLDENAMRGVEGVARYRPEFDDAVEPES